MNRGLFEGFKFFLSREVNKELFEFCGKSFGAEIYYDIKNFESETFLKGSFTHVVIDRKIGVDKRKINADYVSP